MDIEVDLTIEDLSPASFPSRNHVLAAMLGGVSSKLSVGQILDILVDGAPGSLDTLAKIALFMDSLAPLDSPTLIGTPTAPTVAPGDNSAKIATTGYVAAAVAASILNLKWRARFIGEVVVANAALTGIDLPPSSTADTVWIELTSGLTGVGGYNNGKLTSESVSGSAPLVQATATISYAPSPMNGQTVRLINTESRILRPSTSPGTLQDDAMQGHYHANGYNNGKPYTAGSLLGDYLATTPTNNTNTGVLAPITDGTNGTPRTANETRMKNLGVRAYMRIA